MTRPGVLLIAKGSRRRGRCGYCGADVTWATLTQRGTKNIPLVVTPYVLREERTEHDVVFEVLGFDQLHRCPEKSAARRTNGTPHQTRTARQADHVFSSFTPERMEALKSQLDAPKDKRPQSGRLF